MVEAPQFERKRRPWETYESAENVLRVHGVPEATLAAARELPEDERPDLQSFVNLLDGVFVAAQTPWAAERFLLNPHPAEPEVTIHELILEPDGLERMREAKGLKAWQ